MQAVHQIDVPPVRIQVEQRPAFEVDLDVGHLGAQEVFLQGDHLPARLHTGAEKIGQAWAGQTIGHQRSESEGGPA